MDCNTLKAEPSYNLDIPPKYNGTTVVTAGVEARDIMEIHENMNTFRLMAKITLTWMDPRLEFFFFIGKTSCQTEQTCLQNNSYQEK